MTVVLVGAGSFAILAADMLVKRGHAVIMVECGKARIDKMSGPTDCGFDQGDGGTTRLVGRSLGFVRVVTKIESSEFEQVCIELGLKDTIMSARPISRYPAAMVWEQDLLELSAMIKDEARVYLFAAREEEAGPLSDLELPERCQVMCFRRDYQLNLLRDDTLPNEGDEVVLLPHRKHLAEIDERCNMRSSCA